MNPVRRDWPPLIGPDRQRENDIKVCVTFHLYFVRLSGVTATHLTLGPVMDNVGGGKLARFPVGNAHPRPSHS
jgi:hypothetical protein